MKRCCILVLTLILAAHAWTGEAGAERKALNGAWQLTSAEIAGVKFPESEAKKITLKIDGETYVVQVDKAVDKGTVKADASKKPRTLDIVGTEGPNKGRTMLAIYEIDKDTLRVCYDTKGKNRPSEFASSKENGYFLAVYQRVR